MKNLFIGMLIGVTIYSCSSMGGKSINVRGEVEKSLLPWDFCTPEMVSDYKGKLCLVECEIDLKKDGSCKKDKYKYVSKDLKENHEFFMNKYIAIREEQYY